MPTSPEAQIVPTHVVSVDEVQKMKESPDPSPNSSPDGMDIGSTKSPKPSFADRFKPIASAAGQKRKNSEPQYDDPQSDSKKQAAPQPIHKRIQGLKESSKSRSRNKKQMQTSRSQNP